jgi:hypothetical protein
VPGCVTSSTLSMAQYCLMIQMMGRARSLTVGRRLPQVWPAADNSLPISERALCWPAAGLHQSAGNCNKRWK